MVEFTELFFVTSVTKIIALLLGAYIVYLAYRGYRRNASKPLLYVALGFGLITLGTLLEGVLFVIVQSDILTATATGTVVTAIGFLVMIYSIYSVK